MDIEVLIGTIMLFPYNFTPSGWQKCDGTIFDVNQNQVLFSLIGFKFGGNGTTNFAVPNLQGAEPIPGLSYYIALQGVYPSRQ